MVCFAQVIQEHGPAIDGSTVKAMTYTGVLSCAPCNQPLSQSTAAAFPARPARRDSSSPPAQGGSECSSPVAAA